MSGAGEQAGAAERASDVLGPVLLDLVRAAREAAARVAAGAGATAVKDAEAVHDLRVSVRRLRTLLRPARRVYGQKKIRAIEAALGRFADATGALRDEEVLRETLASLALPAAIGNVVTAWVRRRGRQERALRAGVVRLVATGEANVGGERGGSKEPPVDRVDPAAPGGKETLSLEEALAALERRVTSGKAKRARATEVAEKALARARAGVRELAESDPTDGAAMHALRIRFKRLRYTAELFAGVLGDDAHAIAKAAAKMQKRLGELHDLEVAMARVGRARGLTAATRGRVRRELARERGRVRRQVTQELAEGRDVLLG